MRRLITLLGFCLLITACGGGGGNWGNDSHDWGIPNPTKTEIDPSTGSYSFNQKGCFSVTQDSTGAKFVYFSSDCYRYDSIPVKDGSFIHEHGQIGGTDCPTDAYAISGSFVSTTRAEGIIKYGYDCRITREANFIAEHFSHFSLQSQNFSDGGEIPRVHACAALGGNDLSPALSWENTPRGTSGYALIMDDETSPCGTGDNACRHWMVYNIPATIDTFSVGQKVTDISGVTEGTNYTGTIGYAGPCPPDKHTYKFTIYALNSFMPFVVSGTALTRSQFEATYGDQILGSSTLTGTFSP
ncbi:MAG: YbhB/YbcL family Raf kinase inhibitor-like protein [Candidatus Competibacteraceae bacterium]